MINICEDFGLEYDMRFNESKTVCIMFGQYYAKPTLYMSNIKLKWMSKVRHLGNVLNSQLSDKDDIIFKRNCFYHYVNKMIVLFGSLPSHTIDTLFHNFCTSYCGSQLWNLDSSFV